MVPLQVVTGYVPINRHPRSAAEYGRLGEAIFPELARAGVSVRPFYETLGECWLWKRVQTSYSSITHSEGDNPAKNTRAYHCVQHQKFAWLLKAAIENPLPTTFVWIDYGIGHVPGVTAAVILDFLRKIEEDDFAIPGCWRKENTVLNDSWPCWRFCGGVMVVPRAQVLPLFQAVKRDVHSHLRDTSNLSWEVNTLARIEATIPVRWYEADHNQTMFTGYRDEKTP